jgi:outer membrane protein TolC
MPILLLLLFAGLSEAQPSAGLTVRQTVDAAVGAYPSIRVTEEQANAASAAIRLARTAYLPRVDSLAQINRATHNNVFGLLLPQSVLPSISGPALPNASAGSVWGSAVGMMVSWEPFDFGLRKASVAAAEAAHERSLAATERARFEVSVSAADAFLTLAAAEETVRAARAAVTRATQLLQSTAALTDAGLRPGLDKSRAAAELAAARTQLAQAEQAVASARAGVARFTGAAPAEVALNPGRILASLPPPLSSGPEVSTNPAAREQDAAVRAAQAQLRATESSYAPRFQLQGGAFARGTGADLAGNSLGGANGLAPSVGNYAAGLTVTFPVLDAPAVHARESAQASTVRAEQARYRQLTTDLTAQANAARAAFDGATRVAANTPEQVTFAKAAVEQASARYQAGLAPIVDVADAQRLLAQAEIDDALARLSVWRALLAWQAALGDIRPFLDQASQ